MTCFDMLHIKFILHNLMLI